MKPVEAIFPFLKLIFTDRKNLFKSLLSYTREASKRRYFQKKFNKKGLPSVELTEISKISEVLENYTCLNGTSKIIDIAFLMSLCRNYKDCNYLEIGSWRGESLVNVSKVAKKCTSISLSPQDMIKANLNETFLQLHSMFSKNLKNVVSIQANSLNYDFRQLDEKFDVIFIDGDHTYKGVKSDTQNAFKLLRNENSVIIWHDCGTDYENQRFEVISAILDGAPDDKKENIYRVTNTLCGIYTKQNVKKLNLVSPQIPTKTFSIGINVEPL